MQGSGALSAPSKQVVQVVAMVGLAEAPRATVVGRGARGGTGEAGRHQGHQGKPSAAQGSSWAENVRVSGGRTAHHRVQRGATCPEGVGEKLWYQVSGKLHRMIIVKCETTHQGEQSACLT